MRDDELDKLLSEVDETADFKSARKEELRVKQEMARKADTVPVEENTGALSDEEFMSRIRGLEMSRDLLVFKKGLLDGLGEHNLCAQHLNKKYSEFDTLDASHVILQKYRFEFQRHIDAIGQLFDEYHPILSLDSLEKKARRDFDKYFEEFEEPNKVHFLSMMELFLRLREFNSKARKEWKDLSRGIETINLASEGKAIYHDLSPFIKTGESLCQRTDLLVARIAAIIGISEHDLDVLEKDIYNRISYHPSFPYGYDAVFNLDAAIKHESGTNTTDDVLDLHFVEKAPHAYKEPDTREPSQAGQPAFPQSDTSQTHAGQEPRPSARMEEVPFTVRGKSSWNTREPYVLKLEYEKLEKEYQDLSTVFHYISRPETTADMDAAIKRSLVRYLSDPSKTVIDEYEEFLQKTLVSNMDIICNFFGVKDESRTIFGYHLGPLTVHRQLVLVFQHEKYGQCCRYLPGNRVVRFLPIEYMKEVVLNWFEQNINSLDLEFDKIQVYDEIRRLVARKYSAEVDKYGRLLDETITRQKLDVNPQFNKGEYFRSKHPIWFGVSHIQVYNRFIEKTIFK